MIGGKDERKKRQTGPGYCRQPEILLKEGSF